MSNSRMSILATGSYRPEKIVTNKDLEKVMETNDEWITSRTGIKERRISDKSVDEMGFIAAKDALKSSGIKPDEINLIIVSTCTPTSLCPSAAALIQKKLGIKNAMSFDINAACTGFIFAMQSAVALLKSGGFKKALIISSENLTQYTNWDDRTTAVLFGDGASCVVVGEGEGNIFDFFTGTMPDDNEVLTIGCKSISTPFSNVAEVYKENVVMNGREVFKFAVRIVVKSIEEALLKAKLSLDDIKIIVPHQANIRIIDFAAKQFGVDNSKFYINLDSYGNTSSASIPLALDEVLKNGLANKGDNILLVGFGGGLTWGSVIITL